MMYGGSMVQDGSFIEANFFWVGYSYLRFLCLLMEEHIRVIMDLLQFLEET
jgi:hypothetical protein